MVKLDELPNLKIKQSQVSDMSYFAVTASKYPQLMDVCKVWNESHMVSAKYVVNMALLRRKIM